ncbi:DUF3761 domain-containing protein [Streptomyces sp. NPDC005548]|uniref:DUF3761 domain-containing protein n=1 Tax=Streptomyces sp. NPDC005548 TaxID=3364724 RepID=UPI0036B517F2
MRSGCVQGAVLHTPAKDQWQQVNWHRAETAAPVHYSRLTLPRHGRILCDQSSSGTYSYSAHFQGTCSHHRGVKYWYR